jgi:hypothetical protein
MKHSAVKPYWMPMILWSVEKMYWPRNPARDARGRDRHGRDARLPFDTAEIGERLRP